VVTFLTDEWLGFWVTPKRKRINRLVLHPAELRSDLTTEGSNQEVHVRICENAGVKLP